jgi:2'-5' RNA ligase
MESPAWECRSSREHTLGHFALVAYIPDPLAGFLDDLRLELTPGCNPHAHVTILPPRPLRESDSLADTVQRLTDDTRGVAPFRVESGEIEIFEASSVIYLGLSGGAREMRQLYNSLNCGCLKYNEQFPYHPHITIAQNIRPEDAAGKALIAKERWAKFRGPRGFTVSALSLVQHVAPSIWMDVAVLPLGVEVSVAG